MKVCSKMAKNMGKDFSIKKMAHGVKEFIKMINFRKKLFTFVVAKQ